MRYKAIRLLSFTLAFMLTSVAVIAQTVSKSPYSRFGTGISTYSGFAQHSALGRTSIGIRDAQSYTPLNPASYSALKYTVFEAGTFIEQGTITGDSSSRAVSNASFRYLGVAVPLSEKRGWGASFGLLPYSSIGYNLSDDRTDTLVGDYADIRNGNGGISRFYFGTGIDVFKNLSVGFNGYYNFGQLYRSSQIVYPQQSLLFNYVEDRTTTVGGLSFEGGLQYTFGGKGDTTGTKLKHIVGLTYGLGFKMNTKTSTIARTFEYLEGTRTQQFVVRDTIAFTEDEQGDIEMPSTFGIGYSVSRPGKWMLAAEIKQANWSNYRYNGINDNLTNSQEFSIGGTKFGRLTNEDIDLSKFRKLTKNTNYSAGFRFANTNLTFDGDAVSEIGINFGVGIPIRTRIIENDRYRDIYSRLNISAEYFTRGAGLQDKGLVSENYFRITLGVTLNDKWFNKSKFY